MCKSILQVTPEAKKKSLEAKARGDDAFRRKDYLTAIDAYTQVPPAQVRHNTIKHMEMFLDFVISP